MKPQLMVCALVVGSVAAFGCGEKSGIGRLAGTGKLSKGTAGPSDSTDMSDFVENTAAYKRQPVEMDLTIAGPMPPGKCKTLKDYVGRDVEFNGYGPRGASVNLTINIPGGLSVPDAGYSDLVTVNFVCKDGSLRHGNVAKSIKKR